MRVNLTTSHGSWRVDEPKDGLYSDEFSNVDCSSFAKNRIKSRDPSDTDIENVLLVEKPSSIFTVMTRLIGIQN